jgi:two-component system, sensor histidine kinase
MNRSFELNRELFNELFPFFFRIDRKLQFTDLGTSLQKLLGEPLPKSFDQCFEFMRPKVEHADFAALEQMSKSLVMFTSISGKRPIMRGQFFPSEDKAHLLFVGSPWFGTIHEIREQGLSIRDFAVHDPLIDLLHLIQTQDIATRDLRQLLETLSHQRKELNSAREELTAKNQQLSTLFASMQAAVLLEDEQRRITLVNQRFCEYFSIPAPSEALIGADCSDSAEQSKHLFRNPDDFVVGINSLLENKVIETGKVLEMVNGRVLERDYVPIFIGSAYKGHLWLYRDITEQFHFEAQLQAKEEHFRSLLTNMNHGLLEVSMDGIVHFANQRFAEMMGLPMEQILGHPTYKVFQGNEEAYEKMRSLRGTREPQNIFLSIRDATGHKRWWYAGYAPRYGESDTVIGSIGVYQDITQIKELESELVEARMQAEETARARENYLANMSHEIRTLMNAVIGMTGQLARSVLSDKQRFQLGVIQTAADNLMEMINDNLDLSKISAGKMQLENVSFNPHKVLSDVVRMQALKASEKGIYLQVKEDDPGVSDVLVGDPVRLKQILMNLVSNAVKFTRQGGVDISLQLTGNDGHQQELEWIVNDSGIGMDTDFVGHLFEEYSQEKLPDDFQSQGTGLGMHIVWKLVKLMHGEIRVDSKKGKGTQFRVRLSFAVGKSGDLQYMNTVSEPPVSLRGLQILVVDDNEINRILARNILENHQAKVLEAVDGKQAVDMCSLMPDIHLVLMDLQMPVMDGYAASSIIRNELQSDVPIIALSADAIQGEKEQCLNSGMNDYLSKPYTEVQLLQAMARFTGFIQNAEELAETDDGKGLYNLNRLQDLSKGNTEFTARMISRFLEMVPADLEGMDAAWKKNDLHAIGQISHKLKPTLDIFQIDGLMPVAAKLESLRRETLPAAEVEELFVRFKRELRCVVERMRMQEEY